jgi:molybdopterin-containing oxidoreductase family membrane subunit
VDRFELQDIVRARRFGIPSIRLLMAVGLVIVSILLARQVAAGLMGTQFGLREATEALIVGPLSWMFWILRVGLGLVVPMALLALGRKRSSAWLFAAAVLALAGVLVDRTLFVAAGQISPVTTAAGDVSYPFAEYLPSLVEITILAGAAAFMAFMYTLGERYLDLEEADVHTFFPWPWLKNAHGHGADDHDDAGHAVEAGA